MVSGEQDEKLTVRLNFEPAGRPVGKAGEYYKAAKSNICVVCGNDEDCLRKYVVPHEYRKLFPEVMRDHQSHDVLLMCLSCHQRSNSYDHSLRLELAEKCSAPLTESKVSEDLDLKVVRSAGRALIKDRNLHKIPQDRVIQLEQTLKVFFDKDTLTDQDIVLAADIDPFVQNEGYVSHAQIVVNYFVQNDGILTLEKMWRSHFLATLKPQFLPPNWSLDHQEDRLNVRKDEQRILLEDFKAAKGQSN